MRLPFLQVLILLASTVSAQTTTGWQLTWSDEFNGPAGSPPNPANWNYDLGDGGWGNGEAETYTNSTQNAYQDGNGNLVISAIRSSSGVYSSARLQTGSPGSTSHTADLSWQYGLVVARIKLPYGQGVWPAFWMLGENYGSVGWPACGEIDIMENFGTFNNNININNGTAHGPIAAGSSTGYSAGGQYKLPFGQQVDTDYHLYTIQWSANSVAFYVDGNLYYTATPSSVPAGQWAFNSPFFILLNVAIGGSTTFLGSPNPGLPFPNQNMLVDYVRVYQPAAANAALPVISPGQVFNAASRVGGLAPGGLATLYGTNLADGIPTIGSTDGYPNSAGGVMVSVNGVNASLVYVSPAQINFQIPWETAPGLYVPITVTRDGTVSAIEYVTIAAAAPAPFMSEFVNGLAWVTGAGCESAECTVHASGTYQLWANALGPKNAPLGDGIPAVYNGSLTQLEVPGSPASCELTIGGQTANVLYCGAAPGEIIDQINFVYPAGVTSTTSYIEASLSIGGVTGYFRVPAPTQQ